MNDSFNSMSLDQLLTEHVTEADSQQLPPQPAPPTDNILFNPSELSASPTPQFLVTPPPGFLPTVDPTAMPTYSMPMSRSSLPLLDIISASSLASTGSPLLSASSVMSLPHSLLLRPIPTNSPILFDRDLEDRLRHDSFGGPVERRSSLPPSPAMTHLSDRRGSQDVSHSASDGELKDREIGRLKRSSLSQESTLEVSEAAESSGSGDKDDNEGNNESTGSLSRRRKQAQNKMRLTQPQFQFLRQKFGENPRPSVTEVKAYAVTLGLEYRKIRVWFENRRRRGFIATEG